MLKIEGLHWAKVVVQYKSERDTTSIWTSIWV